MRRWNWAHVVFITIVLIGGAIIVVPKLLTPIQMSYVGGAAGDIGAFNSALALYRVDTNSGPFPTTLHQLLSDNAAGWAGPYMATISPDPWSNLYIYTGGADNYTVMTIHGAEYHKAETVRYILSDGVFSTLP